MTILYKCIMANSSAIRQQVARTITTYHQLSQKKKPVSHYFHEKYWKNRKRESNEGSEIEGRRMTWHNHPPFRGSDETIHSRLYLSKSFDGSGRTDEDLPVYWEAALSFLTVTVTNSVDLIFCLYVYLFFVCVCMCVVCGSLGVHVKDVTYLPCIFRKSRVMNVHIFQQLNRIQRPVWNQSDRTVEVQLLLFQVHISITAGTSI